jgi:hypothetical protein
VFFFDGGQIKTKGRENKNHNVMASATRLNTRVMKEAQQQQNKKIPARIYFLINSLFRRFVPVF